MFSQYPHSSPLANNPQTSKKKLRKRKLLIYRYRRLIYLCTCCLTLAFCTHKFLQSTHDTNSIDLQTTSPNLSKLEKLPIDTITAELSHADLQNPAVQTLIKNSEKYPLIKGILLMLDQYPSDLIELAAKKPETIDFVAHYPEYITATSHPEISIDKDYTPGSIPFFLQWDKRWGYELYGDDFIAINGCGPTCLSMVAVGLTNDISLTPKAVADFSYTAGYLTSEQGTSWALMSEGAANLGLDGEMIPAVPEILHQLLKEGTPIIASMRPGHFTTEGHFIVLYDIDENNMVSVHDPDSIKRSNQTWPLSTILEECKCLWRFKISADYLANKK